MIELNWIITSHGRRGFSIVEVVMSMVVVSLMLVAALNALGASHGTQIRIAQRTRAMLLAEDLMAEILQLAYQEPSGAAIVFGRETGEPASPRTTWDDVDDYNGLTESPPVSRDGQSLPDAAPYTRSVSVQWVQLANLGQTSASETKVKCIVVTVSRGGAAIVHLTAYRTNRWIDPAQERPLP